MQISEYIGGRFVTRAMTPDEERIFGKLRDVEPTEQKTVNITREEFDLLDATAMNTIYYIAESNGTVTMIKGDNR